MFFFSFQTTTDIVNDEICPTYYLRSEPGIFIDLLSDSSTSGTKWINV